MPQPYPLRLPFLEQIEVSANVSFLFRYTAPPYPKWVNLLVLSPLLASNANGCIKRSTVRKGSLALYNNSLAEAIAFNQVATLQVALMKTLSTPQTTLAWWVEVSASVSQQINHLGPFESRAEAKLSRGAHVEGLLQRETRDIVALIKQHEPYSF